MSYLQFIVDISAICSNFGIFSITAYGFYLKFISNKIRCKSFSENFDFFKGTSINVIIENQTLSPKSIKEIVAVINNEYQLTVKSFVMPLLLQPFQACLIQGDAFSDSSTKITLLGNDVYFRFVSVGGRELYSKFSGKIYKEKKLKTVALNRRVFNGKVIGSAVRYVLFVEIGKNKKEILILEGGQMSQSVLNFNVIPGRTFEEIKQFLSKTLNPLDINFELIKVYS